MDVILQVLQFANTISPIGVIALLVGLLYLVLQQKQKVQTIGDNHLHEITDILYRMERSMEANFARILERLDR